MKRKAQVGDYIKIIKKPPYDEYPIDVGDVGIVNYIACTTGKYSVHIDGKKNPHDDAKPGTRAYGQPYDFWIPPHCAEVIQTPFKIGDKVIINQLGSSLHDMDGIVKGYVDHGIVLVDVNNFYKNLNRKDGYYCFNINALKSYFTNKNDDWLEDMPDDIQDLIELGVFTKEEIFNRSLNKEREENNMAMRNEKVVELYFKREREKLTKTFEEKKEKAIKKDENQKFVETLKCQFDKYVEATEKESRPLEVSLCNIQLPYTDETHQKIRELEEEYNVKRLGELNKKKEEIIALLSGCENYEQEMRILNTYKIVKYSDSALTLNCNGSETN